MNAVNPSAPNKRKAIAEEPTASGFFQALRDKSIYERLITPPGLKILVIAIVIALLNGLLLFMTVEDTSVAVDLATSLALITLFSQVLGTWLGVIFAEVFARLVTYALDVLERRVDKLLVVGTPERRDEHIDSASDNGQTDYQSTLFMFLYILSFLVLGIGLIYLTLHGYAYADSPQAVYELPLLAKPISTGILYISLAACILLTGWTGARILIIWLRVRSLERESPATILDADIHASIPMDISIVGHINRAHMRTVRFVTGVF